MRKIVFTHSINSIVNKFTSLFLGIYFLKITNGNIPIVIMFYLVKYSFNIPLSFIISKIINKNNVLNIYRLGLLSNGLCLMILLFLGEGITNYILIFAMIDSFTSTLYWSPYKMILYNFQKDNELKNIFSSNSMVTSIISIISILGMGYIITNLSYSIVFIIIFILSIIAVIVTFQFEPCKFKIQKFKLKNLKYVLKDKKAKEIYKLAFWEGTGHRGGLDTAITILLFLMVGTEFSLGQYNALFALLGLITAYIVKKYMNIKNSKKTFFIASILILISTIPIIFTTSFSLFILYNIIFNIAYKITQISVDSVIFKINDNEVMSKYKIEYTFLHENTHAMGKVLSELILLIVTIHWFNYQNYQIVAALLSFSVLIQALIYRKLKI